MLAYIRSVGGGLYVVQAVDPIDPGFGSGIGIGIDPGYDHPIFGRPDNTLPGRPPHISNRPPMNPNFPENSLPPGPPPHVAPGSTLILVRDQGGVWHYAAIQPGQPVPPPLPDHTLPGAPVYPTTGPINPPVVGGGPAPTPPPHPSGQPLPPIATPQR